MKRINFAVSILLGTFALVGCVSSESQVREAIHKNPDLVFDAIAENPDRFLEVVNKAARAAQENQYHKQIAEMQHQQEEDVKNPKKPVLEKNRLLKGTEKDPIVLVEYADFQCPACRMAYEGLKEFENKHAGQVQFYFKNMPLDFHKHAYPAATYFEAISLQSPAKAAQFYDYVFTHQDQLGESDFLDKTVRLVGANLTKVKADLGSDKVKHIIEGDMAEFEKFGFTGTPVVILNGVALNGAQKASELERVLKLTQK